MSRINAVRIINLNYNHDAISIQDEIFQLGGDSTLFCMQNGGGKSVLVQMMIAPFVHPHYRSTADRAFSSYFSGFKPTVIMVEWKLDQDAGYVLVGMLVRKNPEIAQEGASELEVLQFISEYRERCAYDLYHIPIVEKTAKGKNLKSFGACRTLFEGYRKTAGMEFYTFDMGNSVQASSYFRKLLEYQINCSEWETIIRKINLNESGLSDLFKDCKDEKGLVDKWFMDAIKSKLNRERDRVKEFEKIITKYMKQYKENQSKIQRRDAIRAFQEEAAGLLSLAKDHEEATHRKRDFENHIAGLIACLRQLKQAAEAERDSFLAEAQQIQARMRRIGCEELSVKIYSLSDTKKEYVRERELADLERSDARESLRHTQHARNLQQLAKVRDEAEEAKQEYSLWESRLKVARKKEEELLPQRKALGYLLRLHYEQAEETQKGRQETLDRDLGELKTRREELKTQLLDCAQKQESLNQRKGALSQAILAYDGLEQDFNHKYGETLARNILGEYESGALETYRQQLESRCKKSEEDVHQAKTLRQQREEQAYTLQRKSEELAEKKAICEEQLKKAQEKLAAFEEELEQRRVIMKHLTLDETVLFSLESILKRTEEKLDESARSCRALEREQEALELEESKLSQGKVLELSQDFARLLDEQGISYVYGMEWLKKNGFPAVKNQEYVKRHPFLPYSLLLTQKELRKLENTEQEVFTAMPIPIVLREALEDEAEKAQTGAVLHAGDVSFYLLFNQNLLDEARLERMLADLHAQIEQKKDAVAVRKDEYDAYYVMQEKVRNQKVNAQNYQAEQEKLRSLQEDRAALAQEAQENTGKKHENEQALVHLATSIADGMSSIERFSAQILDFQSLQTSYGVYKKQKAELIKLEEKRANLSDKRDRCQTELDGLQGRELSLNLEKQTIEGQLDEIRTKLVRYREYRREDAPAGKEQFQGDVTEMEAQYRALTEGISREQKELEESSARAGRQYDKRREEQEELGRQYDVLPEQYREVIYQKQEVLRLEEEIKKQNTRIIQLDARYNTADKNVALSQQKIEATLQQMEKQYGETEPLAREQITRLDFPARIVAEKNSLLQNEKATLAVRERLGSYERNLTALSQYEDFPISEELSLRDEIEPLDAQGLDHYQGALLRDYRESEHTESTRRESLSKALREAAQKEAFQDDFFKKPLESMLQLTAQADRVLEQLHTTMASYDSLMAKLDVDIAIIEKERDKIIEILEDYIREIHVNLGRIDRSSTISIRDRKVKMLKIKTPQWEENQQVYRVRIRDLIEELTQKGVAMLEANENVEEYLGQRITTRGLYDAVVGTGNVEVRMYKIEAQREYPITWAEVAANSGGEGFLSAFVVLTSLLYYIRRDESDFFADREESKVLVMDNPFAQTNAEHLLKPLMEVAKRTNTQLICLTGLGGDSIYNRFDNIYVLTLITATLRSGMAYLKAEHARGSEEQTMLPAHIQTAEQMELLF